jgi:hypothetical protein
VVSLLRPCRNFCRFAQSISRCTSRLALGH